MKILLVHGRYRSAAPSGENRVVDQESAELAAAGHQVALFQTHSDDIAGWSAARKAAVPTRVVWNGRARTELERRLRGNRPDVVHVHNTFPLLSPSVLHACRDADVPVVATLHNYKLACASGDFFRDGQPCHACAGRAPLPAVVHGCYRGSRLATLPVAANIAVNRAAWRELVSAYICISSSQRELLRGLALPSERVFVKHNFVPARPVSVRRPEHLVAYLGRLYPSKGVRLLMRAWECFLSDEPESRLRLVIAGGGPLSEEIRQWAGRTRRVEFAGLLDASAAVSLLRRALAALIPSQWEETFGLVAIEAMAAEVAPVVAAHGSFPEIVTEAVDGTLFPPGDAGALAQVLLDIDRHPDRFLAYGTQGRRTYERRFRPDQNLEQLVQIYRFAQHNPVGRARGRS